MEIGEPKKVEYWEPIELPIVQPANPAVQPELVEEEVT